MKRLHLPSLGLALLTAAMLSACATTSPLETPPRTALSPPAQLSEGGIALNWEPPTQRTDGSLLPPGDIAGYRIFLGVRPGEYATVVNVDDPSQTDIVIDGLEPHRVYFLAIATIDRHGQESPKSREVRETARPLAEVRAAAEQFRQRDRRG